MADGQSVLATPDQPVAPTPITTTTQDQAVADIMSGLQAAQNYATPDNTVVPAAVPTTDQTTPVTTLIPALANPPQQQPEPAQPIDHHMNFLGRILDRVGSILGGDQTLHVTKDANGNVTLTSDPSTTGEKWHRIAAAALGGGAQGLANAQGPGGLARATAAGIQYGTQLPQQQRQEIQQEATAEQQIQMRNAQNALIHQQLLGQQFQNRIAPLQYKQLETQHRLDFGNTVEDNGGQLVATITNEQEMRDLVKAHPELMQDHSGRGKNRVILAPYSDGTTDVYTMPKSTANQRTTEPMQLPPIAHLIRNGTDVSEIPGGTIPAGRKVDEAMTMVMGRYAANDKVYSAAAQNRARGEGKPIPPTYGAGPGGPSLIWPQSPTQPPIVQPIGGGVTGRMRPAEETPQFTAEEGLGPTPTTPADAAGTEPGQMGDQPNFLSQFTIQPSSQGQSILDKLPTGQANLVRRFGNYLADERAELPRGKERGPFLDLVSSVYPNFSSAGYTTRKNLINSLQGDGKMAQSRNALNLAIQHMGEMYNNMQVINPTEFPAANAAAKLYHDQGLGKDEVKQAYGGYDEANEGVASETARVYKGGAPTQSEINEYRTHSDITQPKSKQIGALQTRAHMLASRLENLNQQLRDGLGTPNKNYQLLTPRSIEILRTLPGGDTILRQAGVPTTAPPQTTPAPPAPSAPPQTPAAPTATPAPQQQQQQQPAPAMRGSVSLRDARNLPQFKGMNDDQIRQQAQQWHYTVTP